MRHASATLFATALLTTAVTWGCGSSDEGRQPAASDQQSEGSFVLNSVDPFIGSANEGNTFPGAVAPWGMVSISPHNALSEPSSFFDEDPFAPSGYIHGLPEIFGFGATHLSGTGCPDFGVPFIMATTGAVTMGPAGHASAYENETASPGYYATDLTSYDIRAEATATTRAGLLRFTFPARDGDANILIDAGTTLGWVPDNGYVRVVSPAEVEGFTDTGRFCAEPNERRVYYVVRFDRDAKEVVTWHAETGPNTESEQEGRVGVHFRFSTAEGEQVTARVGVSFVSIANARLNLDTEIDNRDFHAVRTETEKAWSDALSRVRVEGGSESDRTRFYTALYHTLLHPNVLSDVNGEYPLMNSNETGRAEGYTRYTIFSLWDTYRNLHPLIALLYPERQRDMLRSIAAMSKEAGRPPRWEIGSFETNVMVGEPAAIVVADSYLKGFDDFDVEAVYQLLRSAALDAGPDSTRVGNAAYLELGYVPMEDKDTVWGPVSTTLEYAYADFSISKLADALGKPDDAATFLKQSLRYRQLFDPELGVLRPKHRDGRWLEPFDPNADTKPDDVRSGGPGYVEGTAYEYAFCAPHDIAGLAELHGGPAAFIDRLQWVFDTDRFALWNEPDIAYPYLFSHVDGEGWRTAREVARARNRHFTTGPAGLPGNDDAGTLSAWFVFSALGFYPDSPVSGQYSLGVPLFSRIELDLHDEFHAGERFVIESEGLSESAIFATSSELNGESFARQFVTHDELTAGGSLRRTLSDEPPR
jgi:predicted alpha-1,2-mannosidase